jgi:hypothetical protein
MNQLVSIDLVSGVNEKGEGFVTISAVSDTKILLVGQLPPNIVRDLGKQCFEAAEAAEVDAILYRLLQDKFGLELHVIGAFITDIRNARGD